MLLPTTSSRRTWRACSNGAWWPRPPGCGHLCAKLITSPLIQLGWGCRDSPHSEDHLAWKRTVGGALNIREDSSSLGLAHGTAQLSWLCPGVTRGLRGNPTMIAWARRSWICYSSNRCGLIGRHGILHRTTSLVWSPSSSTMPRVWLTSPNCGPLGGPGSPHVEDGETHPWCPCRLTWLRGEHHGPGQFGLCGVGSVPWRLGRNPCHLARLVDCRHLSSVSAVFPQCAAPVHPPNVQESPRLASRPICSSCGLVMCVCYLMILRFGLQFQAQHVRSKPWLQWCQGSPWRTTQEPMRCSLLVRLHLVQRRQWKGWQPPVSNNGDLNGAYMMRPTSHMRSHPMTAQWHMEGTMWQMRGCKRAPSPSKLTSSLKLLQWLKARAPETGQQHGPRPRRP